MTLTRKTLHLINPRDRRKLAILVPLALIASGVEVIGASLVYSLLGVATGTTDGLDLFFLANINVDGFDSSAVMIGLAALVVVFFVFKALTKIGYGYVQYRIVENMAARVSARLLGGYLKMPYPFHLQRTSSDLIRNANQVVRDIFREAVNPVVKLVAELFLVIGLLAVLVSVSAIATVLAIAILGLAALLLLKIVQPRLERLGQQYHQLNAETLKTLQQALQGIRDIKVTGTEDGFTTTYRDFQHGLARTGYLRATIKTLPDIIIELALFGFILAFFAVMIGVGQDTPQTLAILGLFAYVGQRLQKSTTTILNAFNQMKFASAHINQIYEDMRLIEAHQATVGATAPMTFFHEIRLDRVTFRYQAAHRNALDDVSATIRKGEVIGICGPTGGGKTTFIDMISGLLEPTAGRVTIDGIDLCTNVRGWQRHLGVVPQNVFLTDASLRENIAFGVPLDEVDESALQEAVELAQLSEFVASLPNGMSTFVGERGVRVSGGQRQRVAIARALYHHPSVLIFDEGTSALDNVTEREVMAALDRLRGEHTIFLIAHRLSTVRNASRILLLIDGQIAAEGTYDELLATSIEFSELATP